MPLTLHAPGTRKGNRTWIARGTAAGTGIRVEIATGETDEGLARQAAVRIEAEIIERQRRPDRGRATFDDAARLYLTARDPGYRDRLYIARLRTAALARRPVADIRIDDLVAAADELYPAAAAATRNRQVIVTCSAILHFAAEAELCPYRRFKRFKEPRPQPRAVTHAVAEALMAATDGAERRLIAALFGQGLRIADTLSFDWARTDLKARTTQIRIGKTDEWVTVHLNDRFAAELRKVRPSRRHGPVFPWRTASGVYKWLRPLTTKLKIDFTPHQARHAWATWRRNAGWSDADLMAGAVWHDVKSLNRYGKVQAPRIRKVVNAF